MIVSFFPLTVSVAALEYANNISNLDRSCDQISHITLEPQMSALYVQKQSEDCNPRAFSLLRTGPFSSRDWPDNQNASLFFFTIRKGTMYFVLWLIMPSPYQWICLQWLKLSCYSPEQHLSSIRAPRMSKWVWAEGVHMYLTNSSLMT